jgi:formylmethanofuran dehydrogenase subunit E
MSDKTPFQIWTEKTAGDSVRPWDLINPKIKRVDKETFDYRYKQNCLNCPSLINLTKICKKCGCFMSEKAQLPHAGCPLGKWGPITEVNDIV